MSTTPPGGPAIELASDCARCSGLCCVALPFAAGAQFARSKAAGETCVNLAADDRCTIHERLRPAGWTGCTVYECFGAGQRLTAEAGSWRDQAHPGRLFAAFTALHAVHELLFLLTHAPSVPGLDDERALLLADAGRQAQLVEDSAVQDVPAGAQWPPIDDLRGRIGALLGQISTQVRSSAPGPDHAYRDLAGKDLRGTGLRRAALRGAGLIQADLRGVDLTGADLLGADLRDADLRGARLDRALFLTQPQLNSAHGDRHTTAPGWFIRPGHWA